jgi:hypothetical protein
LTSKSVFIDELADLLSFVIIGPSEKLILCGDLNMPGADSTSVDIQLTTLLDVHGFVQHGTKPTRHNNKTTSPNLLHLVITTASKVPPLVSNIGVHTPHDLSDHSIVVFDIVRKSLQHCVRFRIGTLKTSTQLISKADYGRQTSSPTHLTHLMSMSIVWNQRWSTYWTNWRH